MPHNLKDMNLPCHSLNIRLVFYLVLLQNLDCHFFPCQHMSTQSDLAKSSLTQRPANYIVANLTIVSRLSLLILIH